MKHLVTGLLLRLYPSSWRAEYGDEIREVLSARGLTPVVVADVTVGAIKERVRRTEPWIVIGVLSAIWCTAALIRSIVAPVPYEEHATIGYGAPVLCLVGCWTALRASGVRHGQPCTPTSWRKFQSYSPGPCLRQVC